jgi:replication-associated recombination protein RarA
MITVTKTTIVERETSSHDGQVALRNSARASVRNVQIFFISLLFFGGDKPALTARRFILALIAGQEGIEPSLTVLETVVLPLNYCPIMHCYDKG